jgi:hypothetical protein
LVTQAGQEPSFDLAVAGLTLGPEVVQEFAVDKKSAWMQHVPFMAWAIRNLEPRSYVELGTHYGVSFFAAVQTAAFLKISLDARAIDLWEGDRHAGFYGNEVFDHVSARAKKFSGVTLTRSLFADARELVADGSVDLLHIDGLHTYEAVKEDYDTWVSCLSDRGVIFFHDVRETRSDFGVHILWAELEAKFPSFTFDHGHGLGVLLVGSRVPKAFKDLAKLDKSPGGDHVRQVFATLGAALDLDSFYVKQRQLDEERIAGLEHQLFTEAAERIADLEHQLFTEAEARQRIERSMSWRVTRPLRAVRGLFSRKRRQVT